MHPDAVAAFNAEEKRKAEMRKNSVISVDKLPEPKRRSIEKEKPVEVVRNSKLHVYIRFKQAISWKKI